MANPTGLYGLRPLRYKSGAPYNGASNLYMVPAAYGTALYIGDPVIKIVAAAAPLDYYGMPANAMGQINRATAGTGNYITGVVVGFFAEQATSSVYNAASTLRGVYVADDPDLIFSIRDDGSATPDYTWPHAHANLSTSTAGNAYTGLSGVSLAGSSLIALGGGSTYTTTQMRIHRLRPDSPANTTAINAEWEVSIVLHTETSSSY